MNIFSIVSRDRICGLVAICWRTLGTGTCTHYYNNVSIYKDGDDRTAWSKCLVSPAFGVWWWRLDGRT